MKRIDSGFQESFLLQAHNEPPPFVRSSTTPSRRRRTDKPAVDAVVSSSPVRMESQRPESEKRSRPSNERSKTSSSETSTSRSRNRGHGSKPSSRRTSCTIVDPSRSRHYRIQSSNTVPTVNSPDIDDVYALHHRSYSLFQNPSIHTKSGLPSPTKSQAEHYDFPSVSPRRSADVAIASNERGLSSRGAEPTVEETTTTMHWTSPCTRRREYERIDRANSGVRGLLNRVVPRCVSGPQEKFYEKDESDTGSVRRYRLEDDDDEDTTHGQKLARSQTHASKKSASPKKKWTCF
jgi:hypothetical protein